MSWNMYIEQMKGSGKVTEAAIVGEDKSIWASSPGLANCGNEVVAAGSNFNNPTAFAEKGVFVAGKKYFFLRCSDEVLLFKKGTGGGCLAHAKTCYVLALFDEPIQHGQCSSEVHRIRDYLVAAGY